MINDIDPIQVVVDIGSSRLRVTVAEKYPEHALKILGCGWANDIPCRHGVITDITAVGAALRHAINEAERQSGVEICNVDVAVSGAHIHSFNHQARVDVAHREISQDLLIDTLVRLRDSVQEDNYQLLHALEQSYLVDDCEQIANPQGMIADLLEVRLHFIRAQLNSIQNLRRVLDSCNIGVNQFVFSALASAYAATSAQERELGVCVVDIGAGTSDFMVFEQDKAQFSGGLRVGGDDVSSDLAIALSTTRQAAEELKCRAGSLDLSALSHEDLFVPTTAGTARAVDEHVFIEKICKRYDDIFAQLNHALLQSGMQEFSKGGLVLTGGGAQIKGLAEYVSQASKLPVRAATIPNIEGLPEDLQSDAGMMTTLGMFHLIYAPIADHIWVKYANSGIMRRLKRLILKYI